MGADGRTILVVDDDADVLAICERMLMAAGYRVACVASGGEAIERVAEEAARPGFSWTLPCPT